MCHRREKRRNPPGFCLPLCAAAAQTTEEISLHHFGPPSTKDGFSRLEGCLLSISDSAPMTDHFHLHPDPWWHRMRCEDDLFWDKGCPPCCCLLGRWPSLRHSIPSCPGPSLQPQIISEDICQGFGLV